MVDALSVHREIPKLRKGANKRARVFIRAFLSSSIHTERHVPFLSSNFS